MVLRVRDASLTAAAASSARVCALACALARRAREVFTRRLLQQGAQLLHGRGERIAA
jgi:hypothetical protein